MTPNSGSMSLVCYSKKDRYPTDAPERSGAEASVDSGLPDFGRSLTGHGGIDRNVDLTDLRSPSRLNGRADRARIHDFVSADVGFDRVPDSGVYVPPDFKHCLRHNLLMPST